ncbi:hypothetical protein V6Z11_A13G012400 [Gossypium hirsutum]
MVQWRVRPEEGQVVSRVARRLGGVHHPESL